MNIETPVNAQQAAVVLNCGLTRISAIKRAMGLRYVRYFHLSVMQKWLKANPTFKADEIYPRRKAISKPVTSNQS